MSEAAAARQNRSGSRCRDGRPHSFILSGDHWACPACREERTLEGSDRRLPRLANLSAERALELEELMAAQKSIAPPARTAPARKPGPRG